MALLTLCGELFVTRTLWKCRYLYFKLYNITTLMAKCRVDSFRRRGTGSMCHMFLLNVEFGNACRFRVFQCHFSTVSRLTFRVFSYASVDTDELQVARIFTKHSKCCDKFFVLTMSFYAFISLLYRQLLLQKTLLKSIYVPSALLTKLTKKFHTKLLASAFILESQNCPRKHFALMPPCFI